MPGRLWQWKEIDEEKLDAFWGFSILMGVVQLPSLDDYWSRDPLTHYAPIAMKIPRWRFREISRYLHFVDNQHLAPRGSPTFDRLGKVRPVIDHLSQQFTALYNPSKNVAVDEAMIKFQGRSTLKQYMPMKPIKRGLKVWVLGDSTNGYFIRFEVYTGKGEIQTRQIGLGGEYVVKTLTSGLKMKNHHVYFDNFFTSVKLLEDLLEDGIYGCGTARKDRKGFPPALKNISLRHRYYCTHIHRDAHTHAHTQRCARTHTPIFIYLLYRGESKTVQKSEVTATAWKDNKVVNVLSTTTQPTASSSVLRRQKDGSRISVQCPESIMSYNQHMGGVDRGDQLRGYYSCRTKSRKFYKYILFYLYVRCSYYERLHPIQALTRSP